MLNKGLQYSPEEFLGPLINIATSWLATTSQVETSDQVPQWWKRSFKFQIGLAISALFEYLKFCVNRDISPETASVVHNLCKVIVHSNSDTVKIEAMGMTWSMWGVYHGKIKSSECDCIFCTTGPYT